MLYFHIWLWITAGKFLSEALIFASINPQYDDWFFIFHENCKLRVPAEHVVYTNCCFCFVLTVRTILVYNMFCRCCELLKEIYLYVKYLKKNSSIDFNPTASFGHFPQIVIKRETAVFFCSVREITIQEYSFGLCLTHYIFW